MWRSDAMNVSIQAMYPRSVGYCGIIYDSHDVFVFADSLAADSKMISMASSK